MFPAFSHCCRPWQLSSFAQSESDRRSRFENWVRLSKQFHVGCPRQSAHLVGSILAALEPNLAFDQVQLCCYQLKFLDRPRHSCMSGREIHASVGAAAQVRWAMPKSWLWKASTCRAHIEKHFHGLARTSLVLSPCIAAWASWPGSAFFSSELGPLSCLTGQPGAATLKYR